jgi:hypothetical protein
MSAAWHATLAVLWVFWPWLAAGLTATLVVSLVDRDDQVGVPEDLRAARGCVLGLLISLALALVVFGGLWLTWRT